MSVDDWFVAEILPLEGVLERYIRRNWRNPHDIADIRQEVYARVFRAAQTEIPANARALLFTVARNLIIDQIRKSSVVSLEMLMEIEHMDVAIDEAAVTEIVSAREELRLLQEEMRKMPSRTRDILACRRIEGLSQRETALRLKVSEATVERHVSQGVRWLANALNKKAAGRGQASSTPQDSRRGGPRSKP